MIDLNKITVMGNIALIEWDNGTQLESIELSNNGEVRHCIQQPDGGRDKKGRIEYSYAAEPISVGRERGKSVDPEIVQKMQTVLLETVIRKQRQAVSRIDWINKQIDSNGNYIE